MRRADPMTARPVSHVRSIGLGYAMFEICERLNYTACH